VAYELFQVEDPDQLVYELRLPIDEHTSIFLNGELLNLDGEFSVGPEPNEITFVADLLDVGDTLEIRRL
jgi:hypothetical protein